MNSHGDELLEDDYWHLVEADPRDWRHDQKILFWWVVTLLTKVGAGGVIMAPAQAPLTDEEIKTVFKEILPAPGKEGQERSYMDKFWSYKGQKVIFPSMEGHLVIIDDGQIFVEEDEIAEQRDQFERE